MIFFDMSVERWIGKVSFATRATIISTLKITSISSLHHNFNVNELSTIYELKDELTDDYRFIIIINIPINDVIL